MQELNGLNEFSKMLEKVLNDFPEERKKFHNEVGLLMRSELRTQIKSSRYKDGGRKLSGYQVRYVGSGGGYAAVRAIDSSSGDDSPGAITNYNENGHRIRRGSGKKNYRPKIKVTYVNGRHFYKFTKQDIKEVAINEARKFVERLAKDLQG